MKQSQKNNSPSAVVRPPSDSFIAFFLALLLFGVYLLSFNGRITSSDGLSMFAVTESFVKRGDVSTVQMWTFFGTKSEPTPDGEVYSKYGYGTSLFAAPLYALALAVPFSGLMQVTLLASAIAVAVTGALLYLTARNLKFSAPVGVTLSLLFGLATPAWVYVKEFWSEPFSALTLFAAFYFLLRYRESACPQDALCAGILLGLAIAVRTTNTLLVPLYVWYAFVLRGFGWIGGAWIGGTWIENPRLKKDGGEKKENPRLKKDGGEKRASPNAKITWRALLIFLFPIFLFLLSIFFYNWIRFQNPFTTGYRADEDFSNNILLGAYGLLFSPGKGLFVYSPFLAALPFGIWQFYKQQKRELVFIALLFTFHVLLFSAWYYWWGGTNWAARFLVPTLPFLVLLCAPLVKLLLEPQEGQAQDTAPARFTIYVLRFTFIALVAISFINELAGVSVNSLTYRLRVLNLAPNADWDSIFLPALSPLLGHWQTLKATNLDVAWMRATPDAIVVDWFAVALACIFIGWCVIRLARMLLGYRTRWQRAALALGIGLVVTVASLARYADDPRLGGTEGYAKLAQTLARGSDADDVLILNDDAYARVFFNANRSRMKWYGLSRDPARWDETTREMISQKIAAYPRVWLAYDENVDAPNPMRAWFETNLNQRQQFDFADGVVLVLYETR